MWLSRSWLSNTFRSTWVGQLTAASGRLRGVTAACGGRKHRMTDFSGAAQPECESRMFWLSQESNESWFKELRAWWSLSGFREHDVVFLTPVSHRQPPTLLTLHSRPFCALSPASQDELSHLPTLSLRPYLQPYKICDKGGLYCCASISGTRPAGKEQLAREGFLRSVTGRGKVPTSALSLQALGSFFTWPNGIGSGSGERGAASYSASVIHFCRASWLTPSQMHCCEISVLVQPHKKHRTAETCACVWLIDHTGRWLVVRCVHQSRYLANDAWGWKWPGSSPGPTHRELLSGHFGVCAESWPLDDCLPRFCEKKGTCYVLTDSPAWNPDPWRPTTPNVLGAKRVRRLCGFCARL